MKATKRRKLRITSKGTQKKLMRIFRKVVDESAADRPTYVAGFFGLWEDAEECVSHAAELLLQCRSVGFTEKAWSQLTEPYDTIHLMFYARLMDNLGPEEEERYLAACSALDAAWQKFFVFVRAHHPEGDKTFDRLAAARKAAHDAVVPLFTGEAQPVLTPAWARAYRALSDGYADFAKAVRK